MEKSHQQKPAKFARWCVLAFIGLIMPGVSQDAHAQSTVKIGASFSTADTFAALEDGDMITDALPMPEEELELLLGRIEPQSSDDIPLDREGSGIADSIPEGVDVP